MTMTLVSNRYRVVRELGKGGFGATSLVEDTQLPSGRRCVLKELMPVENSPETYTLVKQRFEREAVILEELGNLTLQIPSLYAYFAENNKFYLVQEYVEGETIAQRVQSQGVMSDAAVRELIAGLLPVLAVVHDRKIVHRDIKPENVILRQRDHKPVLIDFGAVRETMGTVINANGHTTQSIVIGTPGFMASEQAAGRAVFASDLYSLGLTAIYALTGKIPQELPTDPMTGNVQWRQYATSVSGGVAAVIDRAIAPSSRDRCQTSGQMLDELMRSDSASAMPGNTISMLPGSMSPGSMSPGFDQTPMMTTPQNNDNVGNYQPTMVVAHPSYPTQAIQQPSVVIVPKQGISDWAKAMIMGGFIGTFVLIAIFISRPQQTAQVANNSSTAVPTSPTPVPSVAPAASPVAAVPQSAPQQAPPPQTVIIQAAAPAIEKETLAEKSVKATEPAPTKKASNTPQRTLQNSEFNAEINDPPTNCRSNPGSANSVQQVLQRGDVLVNRSNPRYDAGGSTWYQEQYLGCWIHESQMRFK